MFSISKQNRVNHGEHNEEYVQGNSDDGEDTNKLEERF